MPDYLAVAPHRLEFLQVPLGGGDRHGVDMVEYPARDDESGLPFRRDLCVSAAEHALPQNLSPQPDRVQEGLQGYVLVHPSRRPGPDVTELIRRRPLPAFQMAD